MAREREWYPLDAEGQAQFQENLAVNLPKLMTKYGVAQATVDRVAAHAVWIRYWVDYRANFELESEQLTKYYNAKALGKEAEGTITAPFITAPVAPPPEIEGDVKSFTYSVRREVVNKPNYSIADGELLGFAAPESAPTPDTEITPTFRHRTMPAFNLDVEFSKKGQDAFNLEARHAGGNWMRVATLTSDGAVQIAPLVAGQAEQIELRGILLRKNQPVGNYSDIQTALIAP